MAMEDLGACKFMGKYYGLVFLLLCSNLLRKPKHSAKTDDHEQSVNRLFSDFPNRLLIDKVSEIPTV